MPAFSDGFALLTFTIIVATIPSKLLDWTMTGPARQVAAQILFGVLTYILPSAYSVFMHARFGQTLGKMFMKVKVLDVSETRLPSIRQAVLRDIGTIIPALWALGGLIWLMLNRTDNLHVGSSGGRLHSDGWIGEVWFWLEVLTMAFNAKRRALHDYIAGTVVVRTAPPKVHPRSAAVQKTIETSASS